MRPQNEIPRLKSRSGSALKRRILAAHLNKGREPDPAGVRDSEGDTGTHLSFDSQNDLLEPSRGLSHSLCRQLDFLDRLEATVRKYLYSKVNNYKAMRTEMGEFFQFEIDELNDTATEWRLKVDNVRKLAKCEKSASVLLNRSEGALPPIEGMGEETAPDVAGQRLGHEVELLNSYRKRLVETEDGRENRIFAVVKQLVGNRLSRSVMPTQSTEVVEVQPCKEQRILLKFDQRRPQELYILDVLDLTRQKYVISNMKIPPDSAGIFINDRYYLTGGRNEAKPVQYRHTFRLSPPYSKFDPLANMTMEKRNHVLASVDRRAFYAICGFNERSGYLSVCEKYSIESDSWTLMPSTKEARQDPTPCVVDGRFIYIFGGALYEENEWAYSMTVESFDTMNEQQGWKKMSHRYTPAWTPRVYVGAIQVGAEAVMLFGGYNGVHQNRCYKYNLAEGVIEVLETKLPMGSSFISRNAQPLLCGSKVYAVGANSFNTFCLDLKEGQWKMVFRGNK